MDQPTCIKGTRGKMETRSLVIQQFHYNKIILERGHFYLSNNWDKLTNTRMISRTILLLQQPFHTGICSSSGKLHLTWKACQTPPSSSSSRWRKRLRCCMEIIQALWGLWLWVKASSSLLPRACGRYWRNFSTWFTPGNQLQLQHSLGLCLREITKSNVS